MEWYHILLIILVFAFVVYLSYLKSPQSRGKIGEKSVTRRLKKLATPEDYLLENFILFNQSTGRSSQIDHIFICNKGIFVIETKNYSGFVYGNDNQDKWTQTLSYGRKKYKHLSPVKQNFTHVHLVEKILKYKFPVFNLVVFVQGNTQYIESNYVCPLYLLEKYINLTPSPARLSAEDKQKIHQILTQHVNIYPVTEKEHIQKVKQTIKTKNVLPHIKLSQCPYCKAKLVVRKGKYGRFYGCSNYPQCKFTKNID